MIATRSSVGHSETWPADRARARCLSSTKRQDFGVCVTTGPAIFRYVNVTKCVSHQNLAQNDILQLRQSRSLQHIPTSLVPVSWLSGSCVRLRRQTEREPTKPCCRVHGHSALRLTCRTKRQTVTDRTLILIREGAGSPRAKTENKNKSA